MILNEYGTIANKEWEKLDKRFTQIELDEYILMPNHMHGFIIISDAVGAIHELPLRESDFENAIQEDATEKNSSDYPTTDDLAHGHWFLQDEHS